VLLRNVRYLRNCWVRTGDPRCSAARGGADYDAKWLSRRTHREKARRIRALAGDARARSGRNCARRFDFFGHRRADADRRALLRVWRTLARLAGFDSCGWAMIRVDWLTSVISIDTSRLIRSTHYTWGGTLHTHLSLRWLFDLRLWIV